MSKIVRVVVAKYPLHDVITVVYSSGFLRSYRRSVLELPSSVFRFMVQHKGSNLPGSQVSYRVYK